MSARYATSVSRTDRPLDIIVGGAGDRLFGCARHYAQNFASRYPNREVAYLPQGNRRRLVELMTSGRSVNLVGHSWGASDISWGMLRKGSDARILTAIAVDPVEKPFSVQGSDEQAADRLLRVDGTGSEGRLLDGNLTARLGRIIGDECPAAFSGSHTLRIEAPFAHYDILSMMHYPGPDGRSAEDWLLTS